MASPDTAKPAPAAAGNPASKNEQCFAGQLYSQNNPTLRDIQARRLTRRFALGVPIAIAIGEVFLNADRADSLLDVLMSDAAILASLALQHGCGLETITHALKRDAQGRASSPIGAALDRIAKPTVAS